MIDNMSEIDFGLIPISAVKSRTRDILSALLDPPKIILTDEGIPRDWRGLAHLIDIPSAHLPSLMTFGKPTASILYTWSQQGVSAANVKQLLEFLQKIDRYDVVDDSINLLESDAQAYINSCVGSNPVVKYSTTTDNESITRDDANLALNGINKPQLYDAFVLYADEDIDFVKELVERMEAYGFKLCLKDRDLLGGLSSEHAAIVKLVAERCHRLIIILSPAFVKSTLNNFIVDHALVGEIQEKTRKIIPCVYKSCKIPQSLYGFFLLYYRSDGLVNFWEKLKESLLISSNERMTVKDDVSELNAIPTIAITDVIDSKSYSNSSKTEKHPQKPPETEVNKSMIDNAAVSSAIENNLFISEKHNKKNWYSKFLKLGQSSSHKASKSKNSKNKTKEMVAQ